MVSFNDLGASPRAKNIFAPEAAQSVRGAIAHALGGVDGLAYTNSREALLSSYLAGFRLFELDLATTADNRVVCYHELQGAALGLPGPVSLLSGDEFLRYRYAGKYTPLDLVSALRLMAELTDAHLITDTKGRNEAILPCLVEAARATSPELLDRIAPQVYSGQDAAFVRRLSPFRHLVFTRYLSDEDDAAVLDLVRSAEISMVASYADRLTPSLRQELHAAGCGVYVHTVNDIALARQLRSLGVGVYTDFCPPSFHALPPAGQDALQREERGRRKRRADVV